MSHVDSWKLDQALEIAKAHANSGNIRPVEDVIREVYEILKELDEKN